MHATLLVLVASSSLALHDEPKPAAPAAPLAPAPSTEAKTPEAKPAEAKAPEAKAPEPASPFVLGHSMKLIDGTSKDLADYKGKVVIIVNVASRCGFTPQYKELEKLYRSKKDAGLVILAFPANNFGGQEPGSNTEIAEFCRSKYEVTFPVFEKISVKGSDQHPLYKQLAAQKAPVGGDPGWNFTKFVVDRNGNAVARFESRVKPTDPQFTKVVNELLEAKATDVKP